MMASPVFEREHASANSSQSMALAHGLYYKAHHKKQRWIMAFTAVFFCQRYHMYVCGSVVAAALVCLCFWWRGGNRLHVQSKYLSIVDGPHPYPHRPRWSGHTCVFVPQQLSGSSKIASTMKRYYLRQDRTISPFPGRTSVLADGGSFEPKGETAGLPPCNSFHCAGTSALTNLHWDTLSWHHHLLTSLEQKMISSISYDCLW